MIGLPFESHPDKLMRWTGVTVAQILSQPLASRAFGIFLQHGNASGGPPQGVFLGEAWVEDSVLVVPSRTTPLGFFDQPVDSIIVLEPF